MDDKLKCPNCKYYDDGQCRVAPPVVVTQTSNDYGELGDYDENRSYITTDIVTAWPQVDADDWCGSFSGKG